MIITNINVRDIVATIDSGTIMMTFNKTSRLRNTSYARKRIVGL